MKIFVKILGKLMCLKFKKNVRQCLKNFQKIIQYFDEFWVRDENFEKRIVKKKKIRLQNLSLPGWMSEIIP